jgi:hypothetical protein
VLAKPINYANYLILFNFKSLPKFIILKNIQIFKLKTIKTFKQLKYLLVFFFQLPEQSSTLKLINKELSNRRRVKIYWNLPVINITFLTNTVPPP